MSLFYLTYSFRNNCKKRLKLGHLWSLLNKLYFRPVTQYLPQARFGERLPNQLQVRPQSHQHGVPRRLRLNLLHGLIPKPNKVQAKVEMMIFLIWCHLEEAQKDRQLYYLINFIVKLHAVFDFYEMLKRIFFYEMNELLTKKLQNSIFFLYSLKNQRLSKQKFH